jgi:hypothetical protein
MPHSFFIKRLSSTLCYNEHARGIPSSLRLPKARVIPITVLIRRRGSMIVALTIGDTLAFAFSGSLIAISIWFLYRLAIKPEREHRKQRAWAAVEEVHRYHREQQSRWLSRRHNQNTDPKRSNPLSEKQKETNGAQHK